MRLKKLRKHSITLIFLFFGFSLLGIGLSQHLLPAEQAIASLSRPLEQVPFSNQPIEPIPPPLSLDQRKVALGKQLFHEPRLSHNNQLSCASCHSLNQAGIDQRPRSIGLQGTPSSFNAPTVLNSGLNFSQFWDGRSATLEDQIEDLITKPNVLNTSWEEIIEKLNQEPQYVSAFRLYPEGIQAETIKDAIATFERSLTTPNSAFDRFLKGETAALTSPEKAGYERFKSYGCIACHQGVNIGGNMFQSLGVMADYFKGEGKTPTKADLGRFNVTGDPRDRHVFKVPSLRNVALTAPYFHDGHIKTLPEVVNIMAKYQLGRPIPPEDVALIVQFLQTLTGEVQTRGQT